MSTKIEIVHSVNKEYRKDNFLISTDKSKIDLNAIHGFLKSSYWAENIPLPVVQMSIENSLCFGVYEFDKQIGFARVISDYATTAYLADIFVVETHRGKGIAKWLIGCIMKHPNLQNLRRWVLVTKDAHGLYREFGFKNLEKPDMFMEISNLNIYKQQSQF